MIIAEQTINYQANTPPLVIYTVPKGVRLMLTSVYVYDQSNTNGVDIYIGPSKNPLAASNSLSGELESPADKFDVFFPNEIDSQGREIIAAEQPVYLVIHNISAGKFTFRLYGEFI